MSKEPINLIMEQLKLLRGEVLSVKTDMHEMSAELKDLRSDVREIRLTQAGHTLTLDFLTERAEKLREGTLTAIGFAAETGTRSRSVEKQVADLTKRVEKLEKA